MLRRFIALLLALTVAAPAAVQARLSKGDPAPPFALDTVAGKPLASEGLGESGLTIVSFLALDSKPSRELAVALDQMQKKHKSEGLRVIAIAADPADALKEFATQYKLGYEIASDPGKQTLSRYGADKLVPMTYILGPGGMIAEIVPGGGAGTQQVLLAVASKEFARGNVQTAGALFGEVASSDPKNADAKAGEAYALLKGGKLERAEEAFRAVSALGGDAAGVAAEGLAEVKLRQGDLDGAAAALAKAPTKSGYGNVIRGEIAARRGNLDDAQKELEAGANKQFAYDWQKGVTFNNLARISREKGNVEGAIRQYDQAIAAEPYLADARSNKGVALEKAGRLTEAKSTLQAAKAIAPSDQMIATLLRRIEEREKEKLDLERQKFANQLVNDLVAAWRSGNLPKPPADEWTPRALVVSFLDVKDKMGALGRDGMTEAFLLNLTQKLQETGRVKVVEREIIDKLLSELKLGSSELADPATRLKLGRVLAASVIGTGGFYPAGGQAELQLRLIDTETTDIRATMSESLPDPSRIASLAETVAGEISSRLRAEYPLRGKIASADGGEIIVGMGKKHGAESGLKLQVVEQGEPIEVDGEVLGHKQRSVGTLELTNVEDGFAYAKAVSGDGFRKGQHVVEAK
jgi:tetratricopeptide (TPR) repeat protein